MTFKITHSTDYIFDSEVFLEPHYFRFRPREMSYIHIKNFSVEILPKCKGHKIIKDEEQNILDFCWFEGLTNTLSIISTSMLEILKFNPFDFLIYPQHYNQIPFEYTELQKNILFATLKSQPISNDLIEYNTAILEASKFNTISYLTILTKQLHDDFSVEYRAVGSPLLPEETFRLKKGSCRDLSWLQIHLFRHIGIAARFVSGYYYFDMYEPKYELHAWVEVFLPGAGWVGLDPSYGILTGNTHFPLASSANFEQTMPVSGGIRGHASSKLVTQLLIDKA